MTSHNSHVRIAKRVALLYLAILLATESLIVLYYLPMGADRLRFELSITFVLVTCVSIPFVTYLVWQGDRLHQLTEKLRLLSQTDQMTGLLNRQTFLDRLRIEIASAPRETGAGAFVYLDADHFKQINDRHGHAAGDELLRQLAIVIRAETRRGDLISRLGGEEFGIFLPGAGRAHAAGVAERLRRAAQGLRAGAENSDRAFSVSIGIAFHRHGMTEDQVMNEADNSLYAAKHSGRNAVVIEMRRAAAA